MPSIEEQEVLVEQRTDGAQIDHVGGQVVVERLAGEDVDLLGAAAAEDADLAGAGDYTGEAHATRAHDAAVGVELDVRAYVLDGLLDLLLLEPRLGAAVLEAVVLEVALAGLVADGAVQRMIDQQELHHRLLVGDGFG